MKHSLSLLVALLLLAPATALAQSGDTAEGEEATPPPAETDGAAEPAPAPEETAPTEEDDATEQGQDAQPLAEPEPQESAVGPVSDPGLSTPSVSSDVREAQEEAALNEEIGDEDAVDETLEEERLPWRNSLFLYDNEVRTTTFDGGTSTLTYNPTWVMSFSLRPRWYFTEDISLRLRQDLGYEVTNSDTDPKNHRPVLADTILDLVHGNLLTWQEIVVSGGPRITLPTSIASRAYEKYFGLGLGLAATRPFEDVMEGAEVGVSTRYTYTFAGSNVRLADAEYDELAQNRAPQHVGAPSPGEQAEPQASGATTVDHEFVLGLTASLNPIEKLAVSTSFTWWWTNGRGVTPACVDGVVTASGDDCYMVGDDSDTHLRLVTWFTLGAAYDWNDWLNTELTYSHLTGEFNPNASRRNPFWSVDSSVALTATFTLDKLYQDFSGTGSAPAEVVEERESEDDGSARAQAPAAAVAW